MARIDFDRKVETMCPSLCEGRCRLVAYVKGDRVVKVEPAKIEANADEFVCLKGLTVLESRIYHPERLRFPLMRTGKRGEGKWKRISWDEALDRVASGIRTTREKHGSRAVMGFDVPTPHLLGKTMAGRLEDLLECTHANIFTAGDSAGPVGNLTSFGAFLIGHDPRDVVNAKMCIAWGCNLAETYPFDMRWLLDAMEQGTRFIVIDPRFSPTASKADWWIPIRPGTDGALALGMAKLIMDRSLHDKDYVRRYTVAPFLVRDDNGKFLLEKDILRGGSESYLCWDQDSGTARPVEDADPALEGTFNIHGIPCKTAFQRLQDHLEDYTLDKVSEITDIPQETIEQLAVAYGESKPSAIKIGFGLQRTFHGHLNVRAIHLLATLAGNMGITGGGVSDFCAPMVDLKLEPVDDRRAEHISYVTAHEMMHTGKPHPIKFLFIKGSQITQRSNANRFIHEILPKLDMVVVWDIFMTPTAEHADIVLPAATTWESVEMNPWAFPYVQFTDRLIEPLHEAKTDFWVIKEIAKRMGLGQHFDMTEMELADKLVRSSPLLRNTSLEELKKQAYNYRQHPDPYVPFQEMVGPDNKPFTTPSGRIEFYAEHCASFGEALPTHKEPLEGRENTLAQKYPLVLFSSHTRFRIHSKFQNSRWLRELNSGPELDISPRDAEARGIRDGDIVKVFNDRGRCRLKAKINGAMRPGLVNILQGWWTRYFEEGSHQHLTHDAVNAPQEIYKLANMAFSDVLVEVKKA